MNRKIYLSAFSIAVILCSAAFAFADYKIKQKMTMNGQTTETTVLVKGSRQRSESGGTMGMSATATIEQCDLKRNVELNDGKKLYFIEPFDVSSDTAATTANSSSQNPKSKTQKQTGGTVTMLYDITDTGERKQMFGLTARRLKTVTTMQASPGACSDADMRVETDGWYVDLPSLSCSVQAPKNPLSMMSGGDAGDCSDKFVMKQTGAGKLGFALTETRTMKMGGDEDAVSLTQSVETVEFSSAPLDAALFDVPKNYTPAKSVQELYGAPKMSLITTGGETLLTQILDETKNSF